jgi:hypothetical protein
MGDEPDGGTGCACISGMRRHVLGLAAAALLAVGSLGAQAVVAPPAPPFSIGQPSLWTHDLAALTPINGATGGVWATYDLRRALINPVAGVLSVGGEAYTAFRGKTYGARVLAEVPVLGLSGGIDWDMKDGHLSPAFSFRTAILRGGLLGHGTMARVDWLPTRDQTIAVGLSVPVFRPLAGLTRPRETHVDLAATRRTASPGEASHSPVDVEELKSAATTLAAFSNAYAERTADIVSRSGDYATVLRRYDTAVRQLFRSAAGNPVVGDSIAAHARGLMFEDVILPIDSLFGQAKSNPSNLSPLINPSRARMEQWLASSRVIDQSRVKTIVDAYAAWLDVVQSVHAALLSDVRDSRLVWMPVELALTPDRFEQQAQVDSLIARAVGHPFSDQNALTYLRSTDLPIEIARSIYAARSYHVLWTHDFTGRTDVNAIDNVGYSMVADAYYPALTAAVRRYDSTGVFPTYMILQDEFFYEPRDNRLWMNILEDPMHARIRLRGDTTVAREDHLLARQLELRDAVAHSARLQRDAAATGDAERWLRNLVKVHVNIVEPYDFSFRSSRIISGMPFTPDNIMRDHRKLVFYDVNEADPYRGALMIMGIGIGEHYASATWEDRGYRVRGPATLEARRAVREALIRNGFRNDQIPVPLRAVENVTSAERRMNTGDYVGRALQVHNEVGFARKESSVARAMLYNLAPPGSDIIVPDPMWLSDTWAGMLAAAAARGCHVYIVAPAEANAPSPQAPLMSLQHQVLARLLELRTTLGPAISASGGELRVGIFAAKADLNNPAGRIREIRDGLARSPWIRDLVPFDAKTLSVLEQAETTVGNEPSGTSLARDAKPREPQLHQKSQLIARPGAIAALVRQPGWDAVLANNIRTQAQQTARFAEQLGYTIPDVDTSAMRSTDAMLRGYEQSLPEAERKRVSFYFSLGTQNEDPRGIASDAEATLIVSGFGGSAGLVDLFYIMARSDWITTETQLEQYVPIHSSFMQRLARWLAPAF